MNRFGFVLCLFALAAGCGDKKSGGDGDKSAAGDKSGGGEAAKGGGGRGNKVIAIDGSSTVFPITQAMAEKFEAQNEARVTVGVSGTGGGFKKFCRGEIAIAGASRPIKSEEIDACKGKVEFVELPIAYDGLAVVVHKDNKWVDHITVEELKAMWVPEAEGKVTKWSQVRTGWPDKELHLFGPGVDSGTYDYFTAAVTGKEHSSRGDFTSSEDDNVLVQGVSTDPNALGYFGYAYYTENKDALKLVPVDDGKDDNGKGPIAPSLETVANSTYQPLSRPIFIYVSKNELKRPEVKAFIDFYLAQAGAVSKEVGYVPLPAEAYELAKQRFEAGTVGSAFAGGAQVGVTVTEALKRGT